MSQVQVLVFSYNHRRESVNSSFGVFSFNEDGYCLVQMEEAQIPRLSKFFEKAHKVADTFTLDSLKSQIAKDQEERERASNDVLANRRLPVKVQDGQPVPMRTVAPPPTQQEAAPVLQQNRMQAKVMDTSKASAVPPAPEERASERPMQKAQESKRLDVAEVLPADEFDLNIPEPQPQKPSMAQLMTPGAIEIEPAKPLVHQGLPRVFKPKSATVEVAPEKVPVKPVKPVPAQQAPKVKKTVRK